MKTFTNITILLALIFITGKTFGQIGINATGAAPASNAMLDVSSTTKGMLIPRMTTAQRTTLTASATDGLSVYDTDTKSFWYYRSLPVGWVQLSIGGANPWAISGNNITNTNTGGVGIGTSVLTGSAKLQILDDGESFIKIETEASNKLAGIFYKNPAHEWALGMNIGNFSDGRFNLYHTVPNVVNSATSFLTVSETGNVGIGSFTTGALPSERLDIKDGYIKVSGATKTAFVITAGTGSTISGNRVRFSYPGMSSTDILIVNHQFVSTYIGAVGNWYETSILAPVNQWTIFREDNLAMPAGEKFTVLVIKQ